MNPISVNSSVNSSVPDFLPLDVQALPLAHRHLIEASAGTGKTFNITRIAIKVLLVKKISITQLLIVTFTKAATQELRARIAQTLQDFIGMLEGEPSDWDPLLTHILSTDQDMSVAIALNKLKVAVFEMDEAAIFTINSFCGRMLTQSSFLTHHPFEQAIIDDSESIYLEVIQDWFLQQQSHPEIRGALKDMGIETPTKYFETYKTILLSTLPVDYPTDSTLATLAQCSGQLIFDTLAPHRAAFAKELKPHIALIQAYFDAKKKDITVHQVFDWCNATEFSDISAVMSVMLHGTAIKGYAKTLGISDPEDFIDICKDFHDVVKKSFVTYYKRFTELSQNIAAIKHIAESLVTIKTLASVVKRRTGVLDHSDTVSLFSQQIVSGNAQLISSIQAQFPIALIDEFQDTDADQYAIFQHVYPNNDPDLMLLMIGDPKQAIYGFRGGDVFTYLKAVKDANFHWSMDTNYRSTESVVNGYNTLFYGLSVPEYRIQDLQIWAQQQGLDNHANATGIVPLPTKEHGLFDYGIQYNWILAAAKAKANNTPLHDPLSQSGTHFFALSQDQVEAQHPVATDKFTAIKIMSQWVAQEVQRLITSAYLGDRLVAPADIAILVNSRAQGQVIKKIFANCGLNSVILSDRTSIFASNQATNLYRFLNGILNFNQDRAFKAMLGTDLMGLERTVLFDIENDPNAIDQYKLLAHDLHQRWQRDGVMAMLTFVLKNHFTVYGHSDEIERIISNYMQLAEILNEVERTNSLVTMTVTFLYEKLGQKNDADSYCQRLESDEALIKIVTIHGSKGLEYPIVFVPFDSFGKEKVISDNAKFCTYYDNEVQEKRHFLGRVPHIEAQQTEQLSREGIRLLYVAITRAAHRCYLGYQDIHHFENSAIHYVLSQIASCQGLSVHGYMDTLSRHEPDVFANHVVPTSIDLKRIDQDSAPPILAALEYAGKTQSQWQVFSYSKLLKHNVKLDLNEKQHADDRAFPTSIPNVSDTALIRFTLTKGAGAGNLLHNILEKSDFTQPFAVDIVKQEFKEYLVADIEHAPAVIEWLNEVVRTPLSLPHSDTSFTLQQLTMQQTLREPQFYFPLTDTSIESLTQLLKTHRGMHVSIASVKRKLQGMMQGFIDLIFEVDGKYYVSDYKSTHLGYGFDNYTQEAMLQDIQSHHYDLQYLIYTWVLHNLLAQRIVDYDPQIHLGGVYYFYLRGMSPQAQPHNGVYYREITDQDITALHETFASKVLTKGKN